MNPPCSVLAGVAGAPVHQGVALLASEALGAVAQEVALPALACGPIPAEDRAGGGGAGAEGAVGEGGAR